jgi:flagellar biosynthesis protein FlhF
MKLQTFSGADLSDVIRAATAALGEDVAIVDTRTTTRSGERRVQVLAVRGEDVERFRTRLEPGPFPQPARSSDGSASRPLRLALVGPTGAGKTTTAVKLALSPSAFGARKVGLLTLDTFRVGALEQIQTYADVGGLPLEVVYRAREVESALARLAHCDVVLIDTPGRGPRATAEEDEWRDVLRTLKPDEVHLVLPATLRTDVAESMCDAYQHAGVTHMLLSKLDEVPFESGVVELASRLGLRSRWVTDGQAVPTDLRIAVPRLLDSLGRSAGARREAVAA